jgi:fermentation-respiration switch protein FrsA (DUF1100 family)
VKKTWSRERRNLFAAITIIGAGLAAGCLSSTPQKQASVRNARNQPEGSKMIQKVSFERDGLKLVGNLFTPNDFDEQRRYHAIIVAGSFTSVKEQMPDTYARKLANEGFVTLAFDYAHYGESGGQPRQVESPAEKLADLKAAVTYLTGLPYVKAVSMVGVCTSAGYTAYLAADDDRITSIATVAAFLPSPSIFKLIYTEAGIAQHLKEGAAAKDKYERTGVATMIPAYSEVDQSAVNHGPAGSFDYYLNAKRGGIPEWKNEFAVLSWETMLSFDPISKAPAVNVPAIVVHSDRSAFPDQAKRFHAELNGPKELVWADGTHYDYYDSPQHIENAVQHVARFFKKQLP